MSFQFEYYDEPKGVCMSCTVYRAEGEVRLPSGAPLTLCRSCTLPIRRALKSLFKRMEKRAQQLNEERGTKR